MRNDLLKEELLRQISLMTFNRSKALFEQETEPPKFMGQSVGGDFDQKGVYNMPEFTITDYKEKELIKQYKNLSNEFNKLLRENRSVKSEPKDKFYGPKGGKIRYFSGEFLKRNAERGIIQEQINIVNQYLTELKKDIDTSKKMLSMANNLKTKPAGIKPLDITNIGDTEVIESKWGTYDGTDYMESLKKIDNSSSSVYMWWYDTYGKFEDPNRRVLTKKEIEYLKNTSNRKLDQMTDIKNSIQKWTKSDEFNSIIHNSLMFGSLAITLFSGGATAPLLIAAGLDVADAAYYVAEDKPYEAGLSLFFALIPAGPMLWKGVKKGVEMTGDALRITQSFTKPTSLSTTKTGLDFMINTGSTIKGYISNTTKMLQFFKSLISFHIVRFLELGKIDSLFGWIYWLVEKGYIVASFLTKFGLMIGGVFYSWDKIAKIIGIEKKIENKKIQKNETTNITFNQLLSEFNRLVWDLDTNLSINNKTKSKDLYLLQVALYTYFSPSVGKPTDWGVFDTVTEDMVKKLQKEKDDLIKEDGIIDRNVADEISYMVRDNKINSEDLLSNYKKFNPDFLNDKTKTETAVPNEAPFTEEDLKKSMSEQKDNVVKETLNAVTMDPRDLDVLIPNFEEIIKDHPAE
jgi:hypothetical protein